MKDATRILTRHADNPIVTRNDVDGAMVVFNPSPVMLGDRTILVLSVYKYDTSILGGGYVAESTDGVHFSIRQEPLIDLSNAPEPLRGFNCHFIDARITPLDGSFYILSPAFHGAQGPCVLMGKTDDFRTYEPIEVIAAMPNRGASLFPEKIGGKYYRLDRPGKGDDRAPIWISSSPDLIHWGCFRPFLSPGYANWNRVKIGPTPPIKTDEGWLVILHGVFSWTCADRVYSIGAMLLDLEDPMKIIGLTKSWLLTPEAPYEQAGQVDNVVFPCGAIADTNKDELRLYYGAADTCVGLASGPLSAVIEACKKGI